MADREIAPLKTLEELLDFEKPLVCAVEPLRDVKRGKPDDPKILFCHDMMGGYLEDRFIHGSDKSDSYRFHHWHLIDSFVYFSHYMVTIPPPGWISAGHKHGVKVLGTFIVESDPGSKILNDIRDASLVSRVAFQLALVAASYKFDGWLINIESEMDKSCGPFLLEFLKVVTAETHRFVPGSLVIWYDSVLLDGKLDWQNELNEKNACFFDLCDGIFLNYNWTEEMLQKSVDRAGSRKSDVYVGIDVFARKTKYTGGYETFKSVEVARKYGLSSAIFAAGWVYETQDKKEFAANQCRFWDFPEHCCPEWRVKTLPLCTSFCQGFGEKLFKAGEQLQPRDQGHSLCDGCGVAEVCTERAYNGGGCLLLRFTPDTTKPEASPYFRLFACEIPLGSLSVSYTFQLYPGSSDKLDIALILSVRSASGKKQQLSLGVTVSVPDGEGYEATRELSTDGGPDASKCSWQTRKYHVKDKNNVPNAILEEIGVSFLSFESSVTGACLLGELVVKRPEDKTANKSAPNNFSNKSINQVLASEAGAVAVKDCNDEPDMKRQRVEKSS
ncbi:hypothetical protein V5799_031813 [Amblyomma americanum]|uniref:Cytosolic endo-beta-N-acetylglucosaminidase n=1 Tax=Amblyomma americanum TaxID=6943 RepID=A0AAQ4DSY8_AMBAM